MQRQSGHAPDLADSVEKRPFVTGHGYRARESVEQLEWFDRYVKDAEPRAAGQD